MRNGEYCACGAKGSASRSRREQAPALQWRERWDLLRLWGIATAPVEPRNDTVAEGDLLRGRGVEWKGNGGSNNALCAPPYGIIARGVGSPLHLYYADGGILNIF